MPNYFDTAQRDEILQLQRSFTGRTEWPTWLLLMAVYLAWFAIVLGSSHLGLCLSTVLLVLVVVLWMSVQHELLHGHPTRQAWLNKALGYAPFAVWYPYTLYRDTHLLHHQDGDLTVPGLDPESRYSTRNDWQARSVVSRGFCWVNKTVVGRLLLGAPLALFALAGNEGRRLLAGERQAWMMWVTHGTLTLLMLAFVSYYSIVPAWYYLFCISVPALSLAMLRSYYEHRPSEAVQQRTVINEAGWPLAWLFLNLNLHLVHHNLPKLPWYFLPKVYRVRRAQWLARSGGFLVRGYSELLRRHALSVVDHARHPFA